MGDALVQKRAPNWGHVRSKIGNPRKWLRDNAKGLLNPGSEKPLALVLVQNRIAPVQNRLRKVQETLGRPLLPGSKTPSCNPFWEFPILSQSSIRGGCKGGSGQKFSIQVPNFNTSSQVCQQHLSQACFSVAPALAFKDSISLCFDLRNKYCDGR